MSNSMTNEEAIRVLDPDCKDVWKAYDGKDMERCNEACRAAVKALEYRIPKKVNDIERFRNDSGCIAQKGKCPCCNMIVIDYIDGYGDVDSCFHCGQALDWGDEEC